MFSKFSKALLATFPFFISLFFIQTGICLEEQRNPYTHIADLENDGRYMLEWSVNWTSRSVIFNLTVATTGSIGFGFSKGGSKSNSDFVLAGVDETGNPYLFDMHLTSEDKLVKDDSQDYILHKACENGTHTFLLFSRPFETCDEFDHPINDNSVVLLWGIAENDANNTGNDIDYHFKYEGTQRVYLLDPDWTPKQFQEVSRRRRVATVEELGDDLKVWTVTRRQLVPKRETVYWCSLHKGPVLEKRHHLIGFNFRWEEEIEYNRTHHMTLMRCNVPEGQNPVDLFEPFLQDGTGEMCYFFQRGEAGGLPLQNCRETVFAYAIGEKMYFLPDHAGIPFGDNPHEYYALQVHYDNHDLRTDLEYTVNIDLYYTDNLREHDAGIATMGDQIPGSPAILIPPNSEEHFIYGHCGSGCTKKMIPPEGIKIISVEQHTHLAGRRHRIHHFRNGKELPWIVNDDNYDGNFQAMRMQRKETVVLPGDHLITRCAYETTHTNGSSIVGGFGLRQEMCLEYIWYYNKMNNYVSCRSEISELEDYAEKHLGVRNFTWSDSYLDFVVTDAGNVTGMTVQQVADREIEWSDEKRRELQSDHKLLAHKVSCPTFAQLMEGNNGEEDDAVLAEYPVAIEDEEYKPGMTICV